MNRIATFKQELTDHLLKGILPFWSGKMADDRGGFWGRVTGSGEIVADAPLGAIMYGRVLWTFSSAYRMFGRAEDLAMGDRAKDFIINKFYDQEFGGVYWSLDCEGQPLDTKKQFYALGFAIYGLSEYHRATGDAEALEYAVKLFHTIEKHSFDPIYNGYIEAKTRDWNEVDDMRLSAKDANERKTMNTHLHILEPYTNLYRVWPDESLKNQLVNLIELFLGKITLPATNHLGLFFDDRWNERSVGAYSYGHDIEASWLLLEAAIEIGDDALTERTRMVCAKIASASLDGYKSDGSMIYEHHANGLLDEDRHWWVQAETVVGLCYLHGLHADPVALDLAIKTWGYIKEHLIDPADGEWWWSIRADGSTDRENDKAGFWKCPYHNGRMCMEVISLLK